MGGSEVSGKRGQCCIDREKQMMKKHFTFEISHEKYVAASDRTQMEIPEVLQMEISGGLNMMSCIAVEEVEKSGVAY